MLRNRIGTLSYPVETEESRQKSLSLDMEAKVEQIDAEKQEILYRSVNISTTSSPKRDKFFESRKFSGLHPFDRPMSSNMRSISNAEEVWIDNEE